MLPSSGAAQCKASGPSGLKPASSNTTHSPTVSSPRPPYSGGSCGANRPAARALSRTRPSRPAGKPSSSFSSLSRGMTSARTKARTLSRNACNGGGRSKSIVSPGLRVGGPAAEELLVQPLQGAELHVPLQRVGRGVVHRPHQAGAALADLDQVDAPGVLLQGADSAQPGAEQPTQQQAV